MNSIILSVLSLIISTIDIIFSICIYRKTERIDNCINGYEIIKNCYYWLINLNYNDIKSDIESFLNKLRYFVIENEQKLAIYDKDLAKEIKKLNSINKNFGQDKIIEIVINIAREFENKLFISKK